ncbi:hypothetical protein B0H17DRAFT_1138023 [Mycena rosella]|uniref:Uncharacterized protein n=1 Tax=Mycena rosella TaxID=1033263 RepID=A0AAD7D729_MYCRO|nr:hypothetical protein B0H17DRAFT_1138023 [Mycena rosella]
MSQSSLQERVYTLATTRQYLLLQLLCRRAYPLLGTLLVPRSKYNPCALPILRNSELASPGDLPALEPIPNLHYTTIPGDPIYTKSDVIDTTAAETLSIQLPLHKMPLCVCNTLTHIYTDTESTNSTDDLDSVHNRADWTDHIIHVHRTREWEDEGGSYTDWTVDDEQQTPTPPILEARMYDTTTTIISDVHPQRRILSHDYTQCNPGTVLIRFDSEDLFVRSNLNAQLQNFNFIWTANLNNMYLNMPKEATVTVTVDPIVAKAPSVTFLRIK